MLSFPKKYLCTPRRGGKRWRLATLVNEQISQESSTNSPETPAIVRTALSRLPNQMDQLAARVSSKLEDGHYRVAVRLACSEDVLAEHTSHTLDALRVMHPPAPNAYRFNDIVIDCGAIVIDCGAPLHLSIESEVVLKVVSSFPNGSSCGSDGLLPQHLKDLLGPTAGDGGGSLLRSSQHLSLRAEFPSPFTLSSSEPTSLLLPRSVAEFVP